MMAKIRMALSVLLLAFAGNVAAECPPEPIQPTAEMMQVSMKNARDHGFLWRISRDGHSSFLYGTIHAGRFEWLFPGPRVMQALQVSDTVALELDLLDPDIRQRITKGMKSLPAAPLPGPLQQRLRRQAEEVCVPYETIASASPEIQVATLSVLVGPQAGIHAEYAIDSMLAGIGRKLNYKVVSLETPEMQLKLFQMKKQGGTHTFVEDSLAELESGRALKMLKIVAQVWEETDYGAMEKYEEWCECLNTESEREVMMRALDERNPALAASINAMHRSGKRVFAAVGSLHMFGTFALPVLMEKRGYHVERISFK